MDNKERSEILALNIHDLYQTYLVVGGWEKASPEKIILLHEYVHNMLVVWEAIINDPKEGLPYLWVKP